MPVGCPQLPGCWLLALAGRWLLAAATETCTQPLALLPAWAAFESSCLPALQVGLGRTGKLWGHEHHGVEPDMMSLAKPLAGGCFECLF